jgi:uncharacterized damage-inducible protein DinB
MSLKLEDFLNDLGREVANTQKVLDALTDASLKQQVADDHRTLGRVAWHIVTTIPEMMGKTGLKVTAISHDAPVPTKASEIAKGYTAVTKDLMAQVKANWNDATLLKEDDMYGQQWTRAVTLTVLTRHEIYHRGQLTVLMRQAGVKVPGFYGPALEEWTAYGMKPPEV